MQKLKYCSVKNWHQFENTGNSVTRLLKLWLTKLSLLHYMYTIGWAKLLKLTTEILNWFLLFQVGTCSVSSPCGWLEPPGHPDPLAYPDPAACTHSFIVPSHNQKGGSHGVQNYKAYRLQYCQYSVMVCTVSSKLDIQASKKGAIEQCPS